MLLAIRSTKLVPLTETELHLLTDSPQPPEYGHKAGEESVVNGSHTMAVTRSGQLVNQGSLILLTGNSLTGLMCFGLPLRDMEDLRVPRGFKTVL